MAEKQGGLAGLVALDRLQLAERWTEVFGVPVPRRAGADFLRMAIAWKLQARADPALAARVQRRLRQMAATMASGGKPKALRAGASVRPGATLLRTWRGREYAVTVIDGGFLLEGRRFGSLSEVARQITGTRWNGPSFFGLRPPKKTAKRAEGGHG